MGHWKPATGHNGVIACSPPPVFCFVNEEALGPVAACTYSLALPVVVTVP